MKISEFIEWLEAQDQNLEVMVVSYEPDNYHSYDKLDINCAGHVDIFEGYISFGGTGD